MRILCTLVILGTLAACSPRLDLDEQVPSLYLEGLATAPDTVCGGLEENVITVYAGETFDFFARFEDNIALSQYKIDIHHNFDCHGHRSGLPAWSVLEVEDLVGNIEERQISLSVPSNVGAGDYHFSIQLLDASGNEARSIYYPLKLKHRSDSVAPRLSVQAPNSNSVNAGDVLSFSGTVEDNLDLEGGFVELRYRTPSGNVVEVATEDLTTGTLQSFSLEYAIPASLVSGTYTFTVEAYDAVRNASGGVDYTVELN